MKAIVRIGMIGLIMGFPGMSSVVAGESTIGQPQAESTVQRQDKVQRSQYLNIEGTLKEIQGDMYVLEGTSSDKPVLVHVGGDTAFPNGHKEPGQAVQALVVAGTGHALIIR